MRKILGRAGEELRNEEGRQISRWSCRLTEQTGMRLSETEPPYLYFVDWQNEEGLICGCSTRLGGVSKGHLASLNLSYSRGDQPEAVRENFRRLADSLDLTPQCFVIGDQTHGCRVQVVDRTAGGSGVTADDRSFDLQDTDGLVTDQPGVLLCVSVADCVPVYCFDPLRRVVGIVHAGWRGSLFGIVDRMIEVMHQTFGCHVKDLRAAIGPSIGAEAYEVDETVLSELRRQCAHLDYQRALMQVDETRGRAKLDLWELNRLRLVAAGLEKERITVGGVCTYTHSDFLFSHRATGGKRGNQIGFIGLR